MMAMEALDLLGTQSGADKWRRLAPVAIVHFIIQFVLQFIKQGVQGLLPVAAVLFTAGENRWVIIGAIAIGVVVLLLFGAVLSYLKFKFRLSGDTFLIHKGVFKRKRLSLSYDRIQNVVFKQPIYFRPFNLVVLNIESAGSSGEEVSLGGIPRRLAEEIRSTVFAHRETKAVNSTEENENTDPAVQSGNDIIRQPISELVRYGLSNNQVWVFAGISAGAMAQLDWDDIWILSDLRDYLEGIAQGSKAFAIAVAAGSVFSIAFLLLAASAIGAIIIYYNYHLTRTDGRFHRTKGLFERQESSLPESKVQSLVIRQNWAAKLMNRFHLDLKQVGFSGMGSDGKVHAGNNSFLVPSVTNEFAADFSRLLYSDFNWTRHDLKPISKAFTRKMVLWIILPVAAVPILPLALALAPEFLALFVIPFLCWPFVALRRARYGFWHNDTHGIIRSGFIGHKLTVFAFYKVQNVRLWQSPGQRRNGLATLTVHMAGNAIAIPYMSLADAEDWRDKILFEIEKCDRAWM
jgi:putative membrane protein